AAHDMTLRAFGPASVLTGHRALRLGVARFAQQRVKDAVGLLHTAVEALTKHRDVSQPEAQLYLDLCMLSGASDAQQVQGLQERLLASVGSMKDTFGAQSMILSLALAQHDRVVHQALGAAQLDTTLCEALLKQHIRLLESVSAEGEDLAVAQYKLATFYYVQVLHNPDMQADAGAMLQQAMQGLRSIYPDDHDLVVLCKHRMGMVLAASGDHHAASQLLSLSLAHYSPSPSPGSSPAAAAAAAGPHNDSPGSSQGGAGMGSGGEGAGRSGLSGLALEAAFGLALAKLKALPSPSSNIPGAHRALEAAKARLAELVATVGPQHMLAKGAMRQFEQLLANSQPAIASKQPHNIAYRSQMQAIGSLQQHRTRDQVERKEQKAQRDSKSSSQVQPGAAARSQQAVKERSLETLKALPSPSSNIPGAHRALEAAKARLAELVATVGPQHMLAKGAMRQFEQLLANSQPAIASKQPHNIAYRSQMQAIGSLQQHRTRDQVERKEQKAQRDSKSSSQVQPGAAARSQQAVKERSLETLKALPSPSSNIPGAHRALEAAKARLAELVATVGPQHMLAKGAMRQFEQVTALLPFESGCGPTLGFCTLLAAPHGGSELFAVTPLSVTRSTARQVSVAVSYAPDGSTMEDGPDYSAVQRNLALELVRVTEAAALASGRWMGKGDKNAADQAAVDMMRKVLNSIFMDGVVVIGEGEKDEAPMLYCGERIGAGSGGPSVDIAVDPLDGTSLTAQGRNGAVSVIAVAPRGSLFDPGPCMYMEKLAVGPEVPAHLISLDYSVRRNLNEIARALRKPVRYAYVAGSTSCELYGRRKWVIFVRSDVTVLVLDRPRHADLIRQCREAGARIRLISDGDVGGAIEGRLWPRSEEEAGKARAKGYDLTKILHLNDLVKGDDVFFAATGVSDGDLLRGVRYFSGGASTSSMVMRCKSGTVRFVETYHRWAKPSVTNLPQEEHALASGHAGSDIHSSPGDPHLLIRQPAPAWH
ncbi:hypothetical protein QJQ45_016141, partial [Haematococcus lacustris]